MKFYAILTVFLMTAAACSDASLGPYVTPQLDVVLTVGTPGELRIPVDTEDSLRVNSILLNDSRCPSDVTCIWAGNVTALVSAALGNASTDMEMCLGDCDAGPFQEQDTAYFQLEGRDFGVVFIDVLPYPKTTNSEEKKVLKLKFFEDI